MATLTAWSQWPVMQLNFGVTILAALNKLQWQKLSNKNTKGGSVLPQKTKQWMFFKPSGNFYVLPLMILLGAIYKVHNANLTIY